MLNKNTTNKHSASNFPKKQTLSRQKLQDKEGSQQKPRCKSNTAKRSLQDKTQIKISKKQKKDEVKDLLRESYTFVKEENNSLHHQLKKKSKKIDDLRKALIQCQEKLTKCQLSLSNFKGQGRTEESKVEDGLRSSRKKYQEMIRQSQDIAKQSLEKYRRLERELQEQKIRFEQEIENLRAVNQLLTKRSAAETPTEHSTDKKRTKSKRDSSQKRIDPCFQQLKALREKEQVWLRKQQELMGMLEQIRNKVSSFEGSLRAAEQNARFYKKQWEQTLHKYDKSKHVNQQLKTILSQFVNAAAKKDQQVHSVKKMLQRIVQHQEKSMQKVARK